MQRYNLKLQGGNYTEGDVYKLDPIYRQQVVPGQTVNLDFDVSLKTAAFTRQVTTPTMMSVWFFYVPHRLAWSGWTDFISKQDGAPSFPTTTSASSFFFDLSNDASQTYSPLFRRAYKLVYNEYFGSESVGEANQAWYDDITVDTNDTIYRTRNPEQYASRLQLDGAVDDPEFTVVASTIPLNEFYRSLMNARSQQRSQMTGDKYVDTLARMGVDATWMIAERPEFLGTKSRLVPAHNTANTSGTGTGDEVSRFETKLKCQIRNKHFAEHGYIVGVCSIRPILSIASRGAADCGLTSIDDFYSADNLETKDVVSSEVNGFTGTDGLSQRFGYLRNGQWLKGRGTNWVISETPTSFQDLIYPDSTVFPVGDELSGRDYAATIAVTMTGKTPVPIRVA